VAAIIAVAPAKAKVGLAKLKSNSELKLFS